MADDLSAFDPYTRALWGIEGGYNPNAPATGSNRGIGQFSPDLEARYGINPANRSDLGVQAEAVRREREEHRPGLSQALGGADPTHADYYLAHQQGLGGATNHIRNPDLPAWQNMLNTGEGRRKGERWALATISGNMPPDLKGMDPRTLTSAQFRQGWASRFNRELTRNGGDPGEMVASAAGPMAEVTGALPTNSAPTKGPRMPTPMEEAQDPSFLGRMMRGFQPADTGGGGLGDSLQNAGAWLIARDNPAGGAALLKGIKDEKNKGTWSHQIDANTGQIVSVHSGTGQVKVSPLPNWDPNRPATQAYDKTQAEKDATLNDALAEQAAGLGGQRDLLNQAKQAFATIGGPQNSETITKLKAIGNQFGMNFKDVPDAQVAQAISNQLALAAKNFGGKNSMPGAMSDADRSFLEAEVARPSNDPKANARLLAIMEKSLNRQQSVEDMRQQHLQANGGRLNGNTFRQAVNAWDQKRLADEAAQAAQAPSGAPLLPQGVKSIQLIQ